MSEIINENKRISLDTCNISVRTLNVLRFGSFREIEFLDDLTLFTSEELLEKRNLGSHCLREIRKILACHGMKLKNDILCDSESEKKLIQDMPKLLREIQHELREMDRRIKWIGKTLDELHCNMEPIKR